MGYFNNCHFTDRFRVRGSPSPFGQQGLAREIYDFDQRRHIVVRTAWHEEEEDFLCEALNEYFDDLPSTTVAVEIAKNGVPISYTTNQDEDKTLIPFFPPITAYPPAAPRVQRSQLVEIERLGIQVDRAVYHQSGSVPLTRNVAIKYSFIKENVHSIWHEANCLLRIPKHPGIVPLERLVVDRIEGEREDRVVGFATPFIPGGTLASNARRLFKLRHLQQLLDTIDYLNHALGIVHGDIHMGNLLLNEQTDHIQLFDFNLAGRLGWEGDRNDHNAFAYDPHRNDVKYAIFTVYEIITRDTRFRDTKDAKDLNVSMVTNIKSWKPHKDVRLDADAVKYRECLEAWIKKRAQKDEHIRHYTQTPRALSWPSMPLYDLVFYVGSMSRVPARLRQSLIRSGEKYLQWQRPASNRLHLKPGQRLLATGKIVQQ